MRFAGEGSEQAEIPPVSTKNIPTAAATNFCREVSCPERHKRPILFTRHNSCRGASKLITFAFGMKLKLNIVIVSFPSYTEGVMKDFYVPIIVVLIILWSVAAGTGFLTGIKKSFQTNPPVSSIEPEDLKDRQRKLAEEIEDQRKILMENYRQQMRDHQAKF